MWTVNDAPGASETAVQVRTCGGPAEMEQPAGPEAMDQLMPGPPGSVSLSTTPAAVPVPGRAELDTVMVKPMPVPAETGVASAVFRMESPGASTVMLAEELTEGALVAVAVAVFG